MTKLNEAQVSMLREIEDLDRWYRKKLIDAEADWRRHVENAVEGSRWNRDEMIRKAAGAGIPLAAIKRAIGNTNHDSLQRILRTGKYAPDPNSLLGFNRGADK